MSESACTVFFVMTFIGIVYVVVRYPMQFLFGLFIFCCLVILAAGVARCAKADTLEIAAIIESEADRASMLDAVRDAQAIFHDGLGVDIAVTSVAISTVAGHTQAQALLTAVPRKAGADDTVI